MKLPVSLIIAAPQAAVCRVSYVTNKTLIVQTICCAARTKQSSHMSNRFGALVKVLDLRCQIWSPAAKVKNNWSNIGFYVGH